LGTEVPPGADPLWVVDDLEPVDPLSPELFEVVLVVPDPLLEGTTPAQNAEMLDAPPAALAKLANATLWSTAWPWASAA
jgi:hypothetical protein